MKCEYCGKPIDKDITNCSKCGAPVSTIQPRAKTVEKMEPFYFRGFMIWPERHWEKDSSVYYIWIGDRLLGSFEITRPILDAWCEEHGELYYYEENDNLIYKMLRLTIGETEVERFEQKKGPRQFIYEIRNIETPEFIEAREFINSMYQERHYAS